jgi:beta-lactamase superfamily II metal-dependent hydrolase
MGGEILAFDLEFLPVDSGSKSGDAIVIRWKDQMDQFRVGVIDGGTKVSGQTIVDHIKKYYGVVSELDFVLNTHPDSDHCSGLTVVLENFKVKTLWMHLPWEYSSDLLHLVEDARVSEDSLEKRIKEKLARAWELKKMADRKGISVSEPFQGSTIGPFTVLSPSKDWYVELIAKFRNMPSINNSSKGFFEKASDIARSIAESFDIETLREDGETSFENESSVVLYGNLDGTTKTLLTGDVGIQGLLKASDYADGHITNWNNLKVVQIPHHGSRRNVSPSILNRLIGTKVSSTEVRGSAYCSASKESSTHPRKAVTNAFIRRGYKCYVTKGLTKSYCSGTGDRDGWSTATPLPFSNEVEGYD